jgi:hypothetical protein
MMELYIKGGLFHTEISEGKVLVFMDNINDEYHGVYDLYGEGYKYTRELLMIGLRLPVIFCPNCGEKIE